MRKSRGFTDALDLLTEQHADIDQLLELLGRKRRHRREVLVELADQLVSHMTIEEKLFYPRTMAFESRALLRGAVAANLGIKRVLADMLAMDPSTDEFDARLSVLREHVSHHVREEEATLFPIIRRAMYADELAALGHELSVMFGDVMAVEPGRQVPREAALTAPLSP
jgi:iron-sulfur cluster repair protein YtfE (RIC family)